MDPDLARELKRQVGAWADETHATLLVCRRLIEYLGSAKELERWDAAVAGSLACLSVVIAASKRRLTPAKVRSALPTAPDKPFRCSERVARIIAPLVQLVGEPVAAFVRTIRTRVAEDQQSRAIFPYAYFCARFGSSVSGALWNAHPRLAPASFRATVGSTRGAWFRARVDAILHSTWTAEYQAVVADIDRLEATLRSGPRRGSLPFRRTIVDVRLFAAHQKRRPMAECEGLFRQRRRLGFATLVEEAIAVGTHARFCHRIGQAAAAKRYAAAMLRKIGSRRRTAKPPVPAELEAALRSIGR